MTSQYQTSAIRRANYNPPTINADTLLAAARQHAKYLRTVPPREYQMRVFEDGSVYFRNTNNPSFDRVMSLDAIKAESAHFWLRPNRTLWQHVLAIWE